MGMMYLPDSTGLGKFSSGIAQALLQRQQQTRQQFQIALQTIQMKRQMYGGNYQGMESDMAQIDALGRQSQGPRYTSPFARTPAGGFAGPNAAQANNVSGIGAALAGQPAAPATPQPAMGALGDMAPGPRGMGIASAVMPQTVPGQPAPTGPAVPGGAPAPGQPPVQQRMPNSMPETAGGYVLPPADPFASPISRLPQAAQDAIRQAVGEGLWPMLQQAPLSEVIQRFPMVGFALQTGGGRMGGSTLGDLGLVPQPPQGMDASGQRLYGQLASAPLYGFVDPRTGMPDYTKIDTYINGRLKASGYQPMSPYEQARIANEKGTHQDALHSQYVTKAEQNVNRIAAAIRAINAKPYYTAAGIKGAEQNAAKLVQQAQSFLHGEVQAKRITQEEASGMLASIQQTGTPEMRPPATPRGRGTGAAPRGARTSGTKYPTKPTARETAYQSLWNKILLDRGLGQNVTDAMRRVAHGQGTPQDETLLKGKSVATILDSKGTPVNAWQVAIELRGGFPGGTGSPASPVPPNNQSVDQFFNP